MATGEARRLAIRAIALAVVLSACGQRPPAAPTFVVHRVGVVVDTGVPFASRPDLPARLESTAEAALAYWGGRWSDLAGATITLDAGDFVTCEGTEGATGCYDGDVRISTSDFGRPYACVEQTTLVHEIGHAVIGDPDHLDPRWMDFGPVAEALWGRAGYTSDGVVDCPIAVSVWRHPPKTSAAPPR